jgi:hypothetical protein
MLRIVCYRWTQLPTPDTVIDRVNTLGADQPESFAFSDRKGRPIGNSDRITGVDTTTNTNGPPPSEEPPPSDDAPEDPAGDGYVNDRHMEFDKLGTELPSLDDDIGDDTEFYHNDPSNSAVPLTAEEYPPPVPSDIASVSNSVTTVLQPKRRSQPC